MKLDFLRYLAVSAAACLLALFIAQSEAFAQTKVAQEVSSRNEVWRDEKRSRDVPVRIVAPAAGTTTAPVILFSHGLGGSLEGGKLWAREWAANGYIVVTLQHAGSDEGIWKDKPRLERAKAMKEAMTARNLVLRMDDVKFVLDDMARRQKEDDAFWKQADLKRIGMSGHSFGSRTTMAVSGQSLGPMAMAADPRITAAIAFSPNVNKRAGSLDAQFANIRMPLFSITGSKDGEIMGDGTKAEDRTLPFEHMPAPDKYLAFFEGGDHMVFGGHNTRTSLDRDIQEDVKALTLAFWNAYLKQDGKAKAWLKGDARSILADKDTLRFK